MRRTGWRMATMAAAGMLGACGRSGGTEAREAAVSYDSIASDAAPAASPEVMASGARLIAAAGVTATASAPPSPEAVRMIVRTAELSLQVADVKSVMEQVAQAVSASGGFLGASRLWREGESDRASMTVRVPADRLDATVARFRGLAVRVDNASVTGEDVTRQAVDLNAQLVNLRATETELRALLVTVRQRTQKASDVLEVHTELSRVRGEIEQRTAELQTLTQLAALSTITLDLRPDVVATPIATASWQPVGVLRDATRALVGTAQGVATAAIWVAVYGGPLLLCAGAVVLLVRRLRTARRASVPHATG
jgi:Domain of unknown function (DUF4349)